MRSWYIKCSIYGIKLKYCFLLRLKYTRVYRQSRRKKGSYSSTARNMSCVDCFCVPSEFIYEMAKEREWATFSSNACSEIGCFNFRYVQNSWHKKCSISMFNALKMTTNLDIYIAKNVAQPSDYWHGSGTPSVYCPHQNLYIYLKCCIASFSNKWVDNNTYYLTFLLDLKWWWANERKLWFYSIWSNQMFMNKISNLSRGTAVSLDGALSVPVQSHIVCLLIFDILIQCK